MMGLSSYNSSEVLETGKSLKVDNLGSAIDVTFAQVYEIDNEIGSGSFGSVYKCRSILKPNEAYAVKVMDKSNKKKAVYESNILKQLRTVPNVIQLFDYYVDESKIYIVQALAEGGDVLSRLAKRKRYTENDARGLAQTLLSTIHVIHKHGIVHRDLKPENLLLKDTSNDAEILLCDFGCAKKLPSLESNSPSKGLLTSCGTPAYVAPEIIEGKVYYEKVDLWSVGVIIFILLSGDFPFGNIVDDDRKKKDELYERILDSDYSFDNEAWNDVSKNAKSLIGKLLNINPKQRHSALEALQSPWFTTDSTISKELQSSELPLSLKGIKRICLRRKLRAACHVIKISNRFLSSSKSSNDSDEDSEVCNTESSNAKIGNNSNNEEANKELSKRPVAIKRQKVPLSRQGIDRRRKTHGVSRQRNQRTPENKCRSKANNMKQLPQQIAS